MDIKILTSEIHKLLFRHAEIIRLFIIILVYLYFSMFTDNITERQNKLFLSFFTLQKVYTICVRIFLQKIGSKLLVFLFDFFKRRSHYFFRIVTVAEQFDSGINIAFQITETHNLSEAFLFIQHTVCPAECLQQAVVFHILVYIKRIEFLAVKTGKEHSDDQTKIKRLHISSLLFHTQVNVIIICTEVLCRKRCPEHFIVVIHDGLQFINLTGTVIQIRTCTHSCQIIILTSIGCISKNCTYTNLGIQFLEYLVITDKHRYGLYSKQCIELSVKC